MTDNKLLIYKDLKLSIVFSVDSFFYMLVDDQGTIVKDGYFDKVLDGVEAVKDFSDLVHKSILCYKGTPFTHIPVDDFDPKHLKDYLATISFLNDAWSLHYENVIDLPLFTCYAIEKRTLSNIKTIPGNHEIKHISTCFIKHFVADSSKKIMCFVDKNSIHILVCIDNKLKLYNQYKAKLLKDIIYFILLAYQELGLNRETETLWLAGSLSKDSKLFDSIYQYIRHVDFIDISDKLKHKNQKPSHYYLDAYVSSLCAL